MSFVEFKDVKKIYQMGEVEVRASDGLNFTFEEGQVVVIVGPSGSGKTTLLNLLGGMDTVTSGKIFLNKKEITAFNEKELVYFRRYNIGFVFQFYNLIQNLTALENVELSNQLCPKALDSKKTLEMVGLGNRLNNFPSQLSGGEQQRVSIARAIAKNPKLLLCDEPTGALDYNTGKEVLSLLQNISQEHSKTVVIITHNQAFCAIANKVIKIRGGKVVEEVVNKKIVSAQTIEW